MKLTPVKVRGKRGQPKAAQKNSIRASAAANVDDLPGTKRVKRNHATANDANGGGMMRKGYPRLSQLPQEILERVFIASQNLSLPLVNHELHNRLSTDSIKYQLVGAAFGPTWDAWYGLDNAEVTSYYGWISDADRIEGNPHFQSAILACSWAKLPLLLSSFDVWIRQHAHSRVYFAIPELKEQRLQMAPQPGSLYDRAYNTGTQTLNGPDLRTMPMREKLNLDLRLFSDRFSAPIPGTSASGAVTETNDFYLQALLTMHLEIHPGTTIPDDVLAGPFESDEGDVEMGEEKMCRLFWLVRGGACLQDEQMWEVTRQGFKEILQLIKGADTVAMGEEDVVRRLQLASRLVALFGILGVFARQWPKYIIQTSTLQARALARQVPPDSAHRLLLIDLVSKLQCTGGGGALGSTLGWRWRRWRPQDVNHDSGHALREYGMLIPVIRRQISMQRARFFLLAADHEDEQPSAAFAAPDVVPGMPVMHEPWSDFGLD